MPISPVPRFPATQHGKECDRCPGPEVLCIDSKQISEVETDPHYRNSPYLLFDLKREIGWCITHLLRPALQGRDPFAAGTIVDVGSGYGFLCIAAAMYADAVKASWHIIGVEPDPGHLAAAKRIAAIMGVADKIAWCEGGLPELPIRERSANIVFCIEVIEHLEKAGRNLLELSRITSDQLLITTPNSLLPIVAHDTALPFCHWLPSRGRNVYARAFGRERRQLNNVFWFPGQLLTALREFERVSGYLQFENYSAWRQAEDELDRFAGSRSRRRGWRDPYYRMLRPMGRQAIYLLPNLASLFRRRRSLPSLDAARAIRLRVDHAAAEI